MSDEYVDTSGNTEAFRAFAHEPQAAPAGRPLKLPLIIGGAVAAVVILLLAWLALG